MAKAKATKTVSLKGITKEIDKVLKKLESKGVKMSGPTDPDCVRAAGVLRGLKQSVEGLCTPGFGVPTP